MITRDNSRCVVSAALRRIQTDLQLESKTAFKLEGYTLGMGKIYI